MAPIGFSTGCMYKSSLTLDNIISFYSHMGADALEISFATLKELNDFKHDADLRRTILGFSYVSLHAPFKGIKYGDNDFAEYAIKKLRALHSQLPIQGIVIHPDTVVNFKMLEDSGLPFLIENMDTRKTKGILAAEFTAYSRRYSCIFGYVLDLKHVYEHDNTMALANDYIAAMGDKVREIHISGDDSTSNHVPLYNMQGGKKIASKIVPKVPIIIESVFDLPNGHIAKSELAFVRQYSF